MPHAERRASGTGTALDGAETSPPRANGFSKIAHWANLRAERIERTGVLLFVGLSLAYWVGTCVLASRKLMWNDELYTFYIARLPTMRDVWSALLARGEQLPPSFYIPTRVAFELFGISNVSVRLPEILGFWMMMACVLIFVARRTSWFAALVGATFPLVTSAYYYAFEARPYGLVMGFGALALLCWQDVTMDRRRLVSLAGLAASLGAAISMHYYSVFMILPFALGEAVRTAARRRMDIAVWGALAVAVLPIAAFLPLIRAASAYSGAFWSPPQWLNMPEFYHHLLAPAVVPLVAVIVFGVIHGTIARDTAATSEKHHAFSFPAHELAAACGFILIPVIAVVVAKVVTGAFTHRYAMSAVIGAAVFAGFGAASAFRTQPLMRLLSVACLAGWFAFGVVRELIEPTDFSQPLSRATIERPSEWIRATNEKDLPLVVADPHSFTVLSHHGSDEIRSRIVYLADPERALKYLGHNSVERGMLDLLKPWFRMNVTEFQPFMAEHSRFLVYGDFMRLAFLNWLLPELQAQGMRIQLLNRAEGALLLLASRDDRVDRQPKRRVGPAQSVADASHP